AARYTGLRHASVEAHHVVPPPAKTLSFLAPAGLYVSVKAERQDGHKNLRFPCLSRLPVNDTDLCTRKINEYFMARKMLKLHRPRGSFVYPVVMFQKLCVRSEEHTSELQ